MRGVLAAAVAAITLAVVPSAQAAVVAADGQPLSEAWRAAIVAGEETFPQAAANCPDVVVAFTDEAPPSLGAEWDAWASPSRCEVGARPAYRAASFQALCPLVVHEWGHLAGLKHSDDPADIMWPHPTAWPAACGPPPPPPAAAQAPPLDPRLDPKYLPQVNRHITIAAWLDAKRLVRRNRRASCGRQRPSCYRRVDRYLRRTTRRLVNERAALERQLPWLREFR